MEKCSCGQPGAVVCSYCQRSRCKKHSQVEDEQKYCVPKCVEAMAVASSMVDREIPSFPFYSYNFPIDKMRHWIELQGKRVFTVEEARSATGLDAAAYLSRLEKKGELEWIGRGKYQRTEKLFLVDFEETRMFAENLNDRVREILRIFIEQDLRRLVVQLREESIKLASVEVRRCAGELEKVLDRVFSRGGVDG